VLPFTRQSSDDRSMAHSIPAPATYSLRPLAPEASPLPNRAVKRLVRAASKLRAPWRKLRATPSLAEQLTDDFNRFGPQILEEVEGTSRGFRSAAADEMRSEMMCSALLPGSREAMFEIPKALGNRSYPDYYLEPFHGQHNGYLSTAAATSCDALMEWQFEGALSEMRHAAADALGKVGQGTVVDLGMGTGVFFRMVRSLHPRAKLVGVDLSPYMLALYRAKHSLAVGDAEIIEADLTHTKLAAQSARGVTLNFVLHELPSSVVRDALREAHRLLAPGGRLVILDAIAPSRRRDQVKRVVTHRMLHEPFAESFTRLNLNALLSEIGFGPLDTRSVAPAIAVRSCTRR
jgi:SAM-dependent methyltransferase